MKTLIKLILIVGMLSNSVWADGLYLGGAVGSQTEDFSKSGELGRFDSHTPIGGAAVLGTDGAGGILGEVELGYRQQVSKRFSFGMEADFAVGSADVKLQYYDKIHNKTNQADETMRYTLGASIIPAIHLSKRADVFVRAGIGSSQLKFDSNGYMYKLATSRPEIKDDMYAIFGAGLNIAYVKHWTFRLEADYLRFSDVHIDEEHISNENVHQPHASYNYNVTYRPHAIRTTLGLVYTF